MSLSIVKRGFFSLGDGGGIFGGGDDWDGIFGGGDDGGGDDWDGIFGGGDDGGGDDWDGILAAVMMAEVMIGMVFLARYHTGLRKMSYLEKCYLLYPLQYK